MSDLLDPNAAPDPGPDPGPGLFGETLPAIAPPPAYRVLARKYRPADFSELIGQEVLVRTLRRAFELGRVAHAFMLTGVRGVGKTTTARIIARCLNCIGPDGQGGPTATPCGICVNCRAILADRHPDVVEMDAASNTGVDDVREIIEATRFRPMQARTKVFVIDEVHMLSRQAFNALLKTLEEPPPHVKFVFATTELRRVPLTVLSRCQRFDLRRVRQSELAAHFARIAKAEGVAVEEEALAAIARAADGSVRDGLSLLDQAIAQREGEGAVTAVAVAAMLGLSDRGLVFDLFEALMRGRPEAALALADTVHERGGDAGAMLTDLLELVHVLTRLQAVPALREGHALPELERSRGAALADQLGVPALSRAWQILLKGIGEVESAPDRRAAADMVLIRLCHVADLPSPGELVGRLAAARSSPAIPSPPPTAPRGAPPGRGGAMAQLAPAPQAEPAPPQLAGFRDVVALVAERREPSLHAHLLHSVHLVRFGQGVIELRPEPGAPRELAARLAALLLAATGRRWTIALSTAQGEPTLAEKGRAADHARRHAAADDPLVQAILAAFPGARIQAVHDSAADAYGLAPQVLAGEPDMPDFAPPDAEPAGDFLTEDAE